VQRALRILAAEDDRRADAEWRRALTPKLIQAALKPEVRSDGAGVEPALLSPEILATCADSLQRRLGFDFTARLAGGILFMTDKVTMAHSLEARMPFLDRAVVDFALRLPSRLKVHRGREKRVLETLARRHLPAQIAQRRKHGLGYPRQTWRCPAVTEFARQLLLDAGDHTPFRRAFLERRLPTLLRSKNGIRGFGSLLFLQSWWNEFIS
jgi:asparagine synthase (glutamine-hydrolysing)